MKLSFVIQDELNSHLQYNTPIPRFASGIRSKKIRRKLKRRKVN